jgi:ATP-dependent DNA ligase
LLGDAAAPLHLTPATRDRAVAADWFRRFEGAGLDGVIAKPERGVYEPNKRVMLKVKHERECDCVVAGFRWHKNAHGSAIGSLRGGLFAASGARVDALASHPWRAWAESQPTENDAIHRRPGAQSRWSQGKDLSWEPLRPELVAQVAYDHMQGTRFRHTAQFRRWRQDKSPRDCTFAQLEVVPPHELAAIFAGG